MTSEDFVSVVLPCYNEKGNILSLIDAIHNELCFVSHEIIVIDDNSPDGTFLLVQQKSIPFVKPVLRTSDPSLAKSIRRGIEEAKGNILVVMDSDFNHQPLYLPMMIKNMEFYDCVSASRFVYSGKMDKRWKHYCSWIFNIWVRLLTRTSITDNLYGYFSIRREILEKIDYDKIFWGYGDYCIRLMFYLQQLDVKVLQFPAENGKRLAGTGNSHFIKVLFQYLNATIKLVITDLKNEKNDIGKYSFVLLLFNYLIHTNLLL
jgi:dolichol-phosphate mannosyltransferase